MSQTDLLSRKLTISRSAAPYNSRLSVPDQSAAQTANCSSALLLQQVRLSPDADSIDACGFLFGGRVIDPESA
jgi:hypothetical protein